VRGSGSDKEIKEQVMRQSESTILEIKLLVDRIGEGEGGGVMMRSSTLT
jgi:hypothetical protein